MSYAYVYFDNMNIGATVSTTTEDNAFIVREKKMPPLFLQWILLFKKKKKESRIWCLQWRNWSCKIGTGPLPKCNSQKLQSWHIHIFYIFLASLFTIARGNPTGWYASSTQLTLS